MKQILVYGSREFGRVVKALVIDCGYTFIGFIDDWDAGPEILGTLDHVVPRFPPSKYEVAVAIGYKHLKARTEIYQRLKHIGYQATRLIHPAAYTREPESVAEGTMIMAGALIDVNATIGPLSVVWPGAVVSHDSRIGANTFLSPNATVCGHVEIGDNTFVGAGSVVVDHATVPPDTFIKAGSVYFRQ